MSVAVLVLLARYRFPDEPADRPVESAPAPLERLAAAATYEELASIMADLERRIAPRVAVVRTAAADGTSSWSVAPRIAPDRAVVLTHPADALHSGASDSPIEVVGLDESNGLALLRVPAVDDGAVTIRTGAPRAGPRYVGVVEATVHGPVLHPVYVGRMQLVGDQRTGAQQISLVGLQQPVPAGAAIFTLDGALLGLVRDTGSPTIVITGDFLRTAAAAAAPPENRPRGSLGVELDPLTPALARAAGAERGVAVAHVPPGSPAAKVLQPGDVIQAVDGVTVTTVAGFRRVEATRAPGANVVLTGVRRGAPLELTIAAADAAAQAAPVTDGSGFIGRQVPRLGVEVVTLTPRGPAAVAGLAPGDLILAIDGRQAPTTEDVSSRYRAATPGSALLLTIQRGARHHVLALEKR